MENTDKELHTEPIDCHGMNDWYCLTALRDGMYNNISQSIIADMDNYLSGNELERERMEKITVFNTIKEITQYRERYLIRRINQLEKALGIKSIDLPDTD